MNPVFSAINAAIQANAEIEIIHKTMKRIVIHPIKLDNDAVIADIVKVGLLGRSPERNARLKLKDITLPRV